MENKELTKEEIKIKVEKEKKERLKKREITLKEEKKKEKKVKKHYSNPLETIWGKILIVILVGGMVVGSFITLIYLIYKSVNGV